MTETLKNLMDEVTGMVDSDFVAPDLDTIVSNGDQAVRRRRLMVGAAGLAAAAVAATGVVLVTGGDQPADDRVAVAEGAAPVDAVTWTFDRTLHTADGATYDLGHQVKAYVRTTAGYAFTDGEGAVYSYVDGYVEQIGSITKDHPELIADPEGSLVGWVDPTGEELAFVVHDLASGAVESFGTPGPGMGQLADEADPFYFYAIDGREAYVRDSRGAIAVDVDSGEVRVVDADARNGFSIKGVEDGVVAMDGSPDDSAEGEGVAGTLLQHPSGAEVRLEPGWGSPAYFSPDGRWVSLEADEPEVYDATTGELITIDIEGRPFATGYEWIDDDTLLFVAAQRNVGPLEILTCEIPAGTCEALEEDLGLFADIEGRIALPVGTTTE